MQFTLFFALLIFPDLIYSDHVISPRNPQLPKQTPPPAAALARRDGTPTLTFGAASNYADLPSNAPTLTSSGLSIVKRSEATGGVDVYLGPDKQKKVKDIIDKSCPNDPSSQCIQDMAEAFDHKEVGIQARQVGIFLLSAGVLAFAYWLQHKLDDNAQKADHAFLPATDVSQAASVVSSSTLVFVTTTQDSHPITVTSTGKADSTTSGLVVSTATAKGDGYDKGDVVIQVPLTLGNSIHDFIGTNSPCADGQVDKTNLDCVDRVAENVMSQASQGGAFRDLVLVTTTLPGLKDDLGTHLATLLKAATQDITGLALGDDGVKFLAAIAFWIVYEELVKKFKVADQVVIPAASTTSTAASTTTSSSCPPEDRKPNCSNCGGTQKNADKSSGLCPGPKWKACPCVDGPTYPDRPMDKTKFAKAQAALKNIPTKDRDPGESMVRCAGGDRHDVFSSKVKDNIDTFCSKYDGHEVGNDNNQEWYDNGDGNWINFWISKDQTTCGNDGHQKIDKDTCSKAMGVAMNKCAAGATTKGATTGSYRCMNHGFYGADAATAGKPVQCPDSNPLLNFAHNPCDTKCNGAGYENCSPDLEAPNDTLEDHNGPFAGYPFIKFSCYCKNTPTLNSPCAGMKCGDPIKMRDGPMKDGSPRYGMFRLPNGRPNLGGSEAPSALACDVGCPNGNYDCGDGKERNWNHNVCRCSEDPAKGQACVDAIRDYGANGR